MITVQKVLELQKQFEEAKQAAIKELLDQRTTVEQQLKVLGHAVTEKVPAKRAVDPQKTCPICNQPGHDARRHKGDPKILAKEPGKPEAKN